MSSWRALRSAALLSVLALPGCAILGFQDDPKIYREILDEGAPASPKDWSQPIGLQEAFLLANQHNEQLKSGGEDYIQSLAAKNRAAFALLPVISLGPSYVYQDIQQQQVISQSDPSALTNSRFSKRQGQAPLTGTMPLFNFSNIRQLQQAAITLEQQEALLRDLQATTLNNVAKAFYEVLRAEQSLATLETSASAQAERVRDVELRVKLGIASPSDIAQAVTQAASTSVALETARVTIVDARAALAILIGAPDITFKLTDTFQVPTAVPPLEELLRTATTGRHDLSAAVLSMDAARRGLGAAVARYYPSFAINVRKLLTEYNAPNPANWSATFTANIPIFQGDIDAQVRSAWSVLRQSELSYSLLERQIRFDIQRAIAQVEGSHRKIVNLERQVLAAREAVERGDAGYRLGSVSNLDRLLLESTSLDAQNALIAERAAQRTGWFQLLRVSGRLGLTSPS